MTTTDREPIRGCERADCSVNKCECCCHRHLMDHMFACCETMKCETCGNVVARTAVDGGIYYKENK